MPPPASPSRSPSSLLHVAVFASGVAGLTWEILWQHHATTLIGVSAEGTAITLAVAMGGMALGAWLLGRRLARRGLARPERAYSALELGIALFGALLAPGFRLLAALDGWAYARSPALALLVQFGGTVLVVGPPAAAMGATLPALAEAARRRGTSLAWLYGLNVAGAALGVVLAAFVVIPTLGISATIAATTTLNLAVAAAIWWLAPEPASMAPPAAPGAKAAVAPEPATTPAPLVPGGAWRGRALAACTGFVTFLLEVAWFRSLRASFQSTTESFALMLFAVLLALAAGAALSRRLPRRSEGLGVALAVAGGLGLLATPLAERLDLLAPISGGYLTVAAGRLGLCLITLGPPLLVLGLVLPWLLDRAPPAEVGWLYAANTAGSIAGSLTAAWVLLPALDFPPTAWTAALILVVAGFLAGGRSGRRAAVGAALCLLVAVGGWSRVGRARVQGAHLSPAHRVLASVPGPDATVSVVEDARGTRELVIDGLQTSGEAAQGHYMAWMGRLPMLAHPAPHRALVIGFGTGQTANAVRREGPTRLDVVELSPAVLGVSPHFHSNQGVLGDRRVRTHLMDGRAWLRRTADRYDVVTLEPMPPYFAGVNALYSVEFYELAAARMNPGAVIAQWLPLHLLAPEDCAAVARSFVSVFPEAILWVDPVDRTGILLGRHGPPGRPGRWQWPGFARRAVGRDLAPARVRAAVALGRGALGAFARLGRAITDDNQHLAYGSARRLWRYGSNDGAHRVNLRIIAGVAREVAAGQAAEVESGRARPSYRLRQRQR